MEGCLTSPTTAKARPLAWAGLALLLLVQVVVSYPLRDYQPNLSITTPPPSHALMRLASLGDAQPLFRWLGFQLEISGDSFGRFTPLRDYNYQHVQGWLLLLDRFDSRSHYAPSLAAYLYASVSNPEKTRLMLDYLLIHARKDPRSNWWWLSQAVYLANNKLKDKPLALQIAYELANSGGENMPLWARQMPAFIHEQLGEKQAAYQFMQRFLAEADKLSPGELNFMKHFLDERVNIMNNQTAP